MKKAIIYCRSATADQQSKGKLGFASLPSMLWMANARIDLVPHNYL